MGWSLRARRALRLSPREWALIPAAWLALLRARWALGRTPLPALLAALDATEPTEHSPTPATALADAVRRAAHLFPVPMLCLPQSLALARMLAQQGTPCELLIGALPRNGALDAHAWVEHEGRPLNSAPDSAESHPVLIRHPVRQ